MTRGRNCGDGRMQKLHRLNRQNLANDGSWSEVFRRLE